MSKLQSHTSVCPSPCAAQYRMHPSISAFPSQTFYGGRLKDAASLDGTQQPWHAHKVRLLACQAL